MLVRRTPNNASAIILGIDFRRGADDEAWPSHGGVDALDVFVLCFRSISAGAYQRRWDFAGWMGVGGWLG